MIFCAALCTSRPHVPKMGTLFQINGYRNDLWIRTKPQTKLRIFAYQLGKQWSSVPFLEAFIFFFGTLFQKWKGICNILKIGRYICFFHK